MKPSIGHVVHYVSYGTPGGEYTRECRAAIITEVPELAAEQRNDGMTVGLCVLNPTGQFFNQGVLYDSGGGKLGAPDCPAADSHGSPHRYCACGWIEPHLTGGTWHWPERVPE